tara:strand:+ start:1283 stop:2158 length:876 start_codon:yes stop_codon:yes gene_type:complete
MKKFLGILILSLLVSQTSFAKIINIENKLELNVPDNFNYVKVDEYNEYFDEFFEALGNNSNFYYLGTDDSIEFANLMITDQDKLVGPIILKMEKKNFKTEKSMINFLSKEVKKLIKKYNYEGVVWAYISSDDLEDTDFELYEEVNAIRNMSQNELKQKTLKYKKILNEELQIDNIDFLNMKISKFKIEKNPNNDPAFDLKLIYKMFNINMEMEIYAYLNNNKPIIVGTECIGKCKNIEQIKNKINFSSLQNTNTSTKTSNIVEDLNELNELYKSGALTKEEFEKAKKKLLN